MGWHSVWVYLPVCFTVWAVLTYVVVQRSPPQYTPLRNYPFSVYPVDVWAVTPDTEKVANLAAYHEMPVKLQDSVVLSWTGKQHWNDLVYMEKMIKVLPKVGVHSQQPKFTYFQERPLSNLSGITSLRKQGPKQQEMPVAEFYHKVFEGKKAADSAHYYYYFADNIFSLSPELLKDVTPFQQLLVKETTNPHPTEPRKMLVWMGSANVTTHLHYDYSHNFHAVLRGKKHFLLFPPSDWENLYLYPSLHPYSTKGQVVIDNPDLIAFPKLAQATGFEVEVNAGEALYIPPLWFHEVKALESSISVSIWSQSIETAMYDAVVRMGVPFDKSWTKKQMVLAAILYIDQLFTACEEFNDMAAEEKAHEQGHEASFSDLFTSLWNGLIPDSPNEGDSASPSQRGKDLIRRLILSRYQHIRAQVGEATRAWPLCPSPADLTNSDARVMAMSFSDSVDSIVEKLGVIGSERREIWLGDYIELLSNLVVSPEEIIPFMGCLRSVMKG